MVYISNSDSGWYQKRNTLLISSELTDLKCIIHKISGYTFKEPVTIGGEILLKTNNLEKAIMFCNQNAHCTGVQNLYCDGLDYKAKDGAVKTWNSVPGRKYCSWVILFNS